MPAGVGRLTVSDFRLTPDLKLIAPQVEIVASGNASDQQELSAFMSDIIDYLVSSAESFIALLCIANKKSFGPFPLAICEIPSDRRAESNPHQRISFGLVMSGRVHPLLG